MTLKEFVFGLFTAGLIALGVSNAPNEFENDDKDDQIENTANKDGDEDIEPPKVKIPTNG
ncbi:MAG: hypothetical protein HRT69_16035 [Flavobacteriaceae bacterium]|nr:hypothetical protein [Flavobacteriaceae bacterium]